MSENKNIPEIIYIVNHDLDNMHFIGGLTMVDASSIEDCIPKYASIEYILKSKYDSLLKEKEELEKKLSEVKKRTEIIKQDAEYKLQENSDRPLSESTIEADACIDVCNEILMTIIKPTEK